MSAALENAKRLIAAESVTPATGEVFDVLEAQLTPLGFEVQRFTRGEGDEGSDDAPVENLFAIRTGPEGSKHFSFAGHLDVVTKSLPRAKCSTGAAHRSIQKLGVICFTGAAR